MYCPNCGHSIINNSKFCMSCGMAIVEDDESYDSDIDEQTSNNLNSSKTKETNKKRPWTLAFSLFTMILGLGSLFVHITWPSIIVSLIAIVLGIICISKKSMLYGFAIAGIIFAELNFVTYVVWYDQWETSMTESHLSTADHSTAQSKEKSGVDPKLVEFLDSYEKFVDEYVDFMGKYTANPSDLTLMSEYADMLEEYNNFSIALSKYDTNNMSNEDASYYLEVTTRCYQKLLNVYETTN